MAEQFSKFLVLKTNTLLKVNKKKQKRKKRKHNQQNKTKKDTINKIKPKKQITLNKT